MTTKVSVVAVAQSIQDALVNELQPQHIQLINDSGKHSSGINNPAAETHFTLILVADKFTGLSMVERHRLIYKLLAEQMAQGVHALSLQLHTQAEWGDKKKAIITSPACANL
ncbi:MAG: BolA family transcriptional regulator [Candidatus Portiera sp.]|nr:BolA family transcriptional regulator [Portiera sp.]